MAYRGLPFFAGILFVASGLFGANVAPITKVTDFSDVHEWVSELPANVTVAPAEDGLLRVSAKPSTDKQRQVIRIKAKSPHALPASAVRAGLWVFVEEPMPLDKAYLTFEDTAGTVFDYTIPALESWATGWQYIDTFPFDANERGKMHPLVGTAAGHPGALPKMPLTFRGIRLESASAMKGSWLLKSVEADSYTLGMPTYYWALNRPRERYWMTSTLQRTGEKPFVPVGWILPSGGDADLFWELTSGYQGRVIRKGNMRANFAALDFNAQAQRIELGDLPEGNYQFCVSTVQHDLSQAMPDGWRRLVWSATGTADIDVNKAGEGKRSFHGSKNDGKGYAGWRTIVRVPQPGTYVFSALASGDGKPEARITAFDRGMQKVGQTLEIKFGNSAEWVAKKVNFAVPSEADRVQVDIVATQNGQAWFDAISFKDDAHEIIKSGDAESAQVLTQLVMPLSVIASPAQPTQVHNPVLVVNPGEKMTIPMPDWSARNGEKTWVIQDQAGNKVADGIVSGPNLEWSPATPGVYTITMTLQDGQLILDKQVLRLGCRTPIASLGESTFVAREKVATEKDLFGPGKNYFTWAVYENHPDEPEYFEQFHTWVQDGRKAGFDLFRIRTDWNWLELLPGVYDFSAIDRMVADVAQQGGKAIIEVRFEAPEWLEIYPQLDSYGRADIWRPGKVGRIPSIWTPGMLDAIKKFTQVTALRYRNNTDVVGYHFWGLPGSLDWTNLDRPWLGKRVDYSSVALAEFTKWSNGKYATPPQPSTQYDVPDLSQGWRDWVSFRRSAMEKYLIDSVVKPLRDLDDRRSVVCYFGLDFASDKLAESARTLGWRRHTGGCELYYQTQVHAMRAIMDTGRAYPQEVHLMTPIPGGLEQATFQISAAGGEAMNWNYYWRSTIRVGQWTPDREQALEEWQKLWRPMWQEFRDAKLAQQPDMGVLTTWSTMQYLVRSFFSMRQDDYTTRLAAAAYRDHLWPTWFSENSAMTSLSQLKLIVIPPSGAQIVPERTARALTDYVRQGGKMVLFPDSAKWIVDDGGKPYGMLRRLGCPSIPNENADVKSTMEVGNSGLPLEKQAGKQKVRLNDTIFAGIESLNLTDMIPLVKSQNADVLATRTDGSAAVIRWKFGRGEVILFSGAPE